MKIYVVVGITGRYDDYREWAVCAYKTKEQAIEHMKKAQEYANKVFESRKELPENIYENLIHWRFFGNHSVFDKGMEIDTWTKYETPGPNVKSTATLRLFETRKDISRNTLGRRLKNDRWTNHTNLYSWWNLDWNSLSSVVKRRG